MECFLERYLFVLETDIDFALLSDNWQPLDRATQLNQLQHSIDDRNKAKKFYLNAIAMWTLRS